MKFKAAILHKSRSDLLVDEIYIREKLKVGQVLVKLKYSGICGSQINEIDAVKGKDKYLPHLLGHEGSGVIVDLKTNRNDIKKYDNVILHWKKGIGQDSQTPIYDWNKKKLNAGWVTTFNEYVIISENRITPFSKNKLDHKHASLFGCCLTTAFGTLNNISNLKLGENILIIGLGGVGINLVLGARLSGANKIIGIEINKNNVQIAKKYGLTSSFESFDKLKKEYNNFDKVIDTTGDLTLIEKGYEFTSSKGTLTMVGVPKSNKKAKFYTLPIHFGKSIKGSHGGSIFPTEDIPKYINIIKSNKIDLNPQTKFEFSIDNINEAIKKFRKNSSGRIMIKFDDKS